MKNNLLKTVVILSLMFGFMSCSNDDDNNNDTLIEFGELPTVTQNFINTHFPDADVLRIEEDDTPANGDDYYEVKLSNGFELDFNADGEWTDIDGNGNRVPDAIIPEAILTYTNANHSSNFIDGIEKKSYGYKIELNNDLDLKFDAEGTYIGIDN